MTTQHTPGPWWVDQGVDGLDLPGHVTINAKNKLALAQVVWVMEDDAAEGKPSPEREANARLIAAAPDLLEALENTLKFLVSETCEHPAAVSARAAIAKAKGESA